MDRREFIEHAQQLSTGLLVGASALSATSCAGVPYMMPRGSASQLVIGIDELPPGGVLIQRSEMEWPVFLRQYEEGSFIALLVRCTHHGCKPDPVGDRLVCPCHGSEYGLTGEVLQGPAERPLTRYAVTVEGDDIIVSLGSIDRRETE